MYHRICRFGLWVRKLLYSFSEVAGNTVLIGKTDVGKYAIPSHFPPQKCSSQILGQSIHLLGPILHFLRPIPVGIPDPLRNQSSTAIFRLLSDLLRGVKARQLNPIKIYKQELMEITYIFNSNIF